ncbi:MAG: hypothetical protein QOJ01_1160 [Solirubrobacterales bacterium]|jgi:hypothetical protein|nr:hypothetical protein [Solirubrobacterales bacterium]
MTEHEVSSEDFDRLKRHEEERRPVEEAGGGVSEGFEQAEKDLIENASHESDSSSDPAHRAGKPEDRAGDAEFGESDAEEQEDL